MYCTSLLKSTGLKLKIKVSFVFLLSHQPREKGKLRVHHVSNIEIGLKTLEKDNVSYCIMFCN